MTVFLHILFCVSRSIPLKLEWEARSGNHLLQFHVLRTYFSSLHLSETLQLMSVIIFPQRVSFQVHHPKQEGQVIMFNKISMLPVKELLRFSFLVLNDCAIIWIRKLRVRGVIKKHLRNFCFLDEDGAWI